jgi:hypothetical protein
MTQRRTRGTPSKSSTPAKQGTKRKVSDLGQDDNQKATKRSTPGKTKNHLGEAPAAVFPPLSIIMSNSGSSKLQISDFYYFDMKDKPLGEGSFAKVYKGWKKNNSNEVVAIKAIDCLKLTPNEIDLTLREVEILKKLFPHPNVVELKDFFDDGLDNNIYIVLEFISGGDVFDRIIKKKSFNEREARDIMLSLLNAIKHCHDHNIVHRYAFCFSSFVAFEHFPLLL